MCGTRNGWMAVLEGAQKVVDGVAWAAAAASRNAVAANLFMCGIPFRSPAHFANDGPGNRPALGTPPPGQGYAVARDPAPTDENVGRGVAPIQFRGSFRRC